MLPVSSLEQLKDPFMPAASVFPEFSRNDLLEASIKYISGMIFGPKMPPGNPNNSLYKAIQRWRAESRFNDEIEVREALQGLLPSMVEINYQQACEQQKNWCQYVEAKRVVRVYDSVLHDELWLNEANRYSGIAVRFKVTEESLFSQLKAANYQTKPPKTVSLSQYVQLLCGERYEINFDPESCLLTQAQASKSQKEWRLLLAAEPGKTSCSIACETISAIYIGPLVSDDKRSHLINWLSQHLPDVDLQQVSTHPLEYKLQNEKIPLAGQ